MNVYQELQNPGIHWPSRPPVSLHQVPQAEPRFRDTLQPVAIWNALEQQMAEFAAQHEAAVRKLRKHYVLPADASVLDFLTEHRTIPQVLLEALPELKTCFGGNTVFHLRAPVDEAGSRTLYAVAMWPGEVADARNALARFDDAWWLSRAGQTAGRLTFTYELV